METELLPVEIPRKLVIFENFFEKLAKKGEILRTFCENTKVKPWKFEKYLLPVRKINFRFRLKLFSIFRPHFDQLFATEADFRSASPHFWVLRHRCAVLGQKPLPFTGILVLKKKKKMLISKISGLGTLLMLQHEQWKRYKWDFLLLIYFYLILWKYHKIC